jgi:single-stranded DNA-binding protein
MNRTTVTGKLTKDPEFKQHGSFNSVTFSLHHSRYAGKNQQTGQVNWETEFFDFEITGNPKQNGQPDEATAFMQRGFHKGDHLWVEATQKTNTYKDNQSGQDKKFKRLIVDNYEQVQPRPQQQQQQQQAQPGYQQQSTAPNYAPAPGYAQAPPPNYTPAPGFPPQTQTAGPPAPNYAPQPPATAPGYAPAPQNYAPAPGYAPAPVPNYAPAPTQQPQFRPPAPGPVPMPAPGQVAAPAPGPAAPSPQFVGGQSAPF